MKSGDANESKVDTMNIKTQLRLGVLWALLTVPYLCAAQDANVSIFIFLKGEPLSNVRILNGDDELGITDSLGNVRFSLPEGEYVLDFKSLEDPIYQYNISLQEDEIVQLLVDFKVKDEEPVVDVETSKPQQSTAETTSDEPQSDVITTFTGKITSAEDQRPVSGARVFISGISDFLTTDENGEFTTEIRVGTYNISVLQAQFNSQIKNDVEITEAGPNQLTLELTPAGSELPEFVVVEPFIEGSLASVLEERKSNNSVANYLSMEQISKSGDSDAAGALKRVTGLTLVDGKFIFVRGLGERYSSTLFNSANVPSPDPTRRVVPLDLFPTGIIESIEVQKGYSANLPAEFGGGAVVLKTIRIPNENFLKVGTSFAHNSQTTGKEGLTSRGGDRDWTGYDDGSRDLPTILEEATAGNRPLFPANPFFPEGFSPEELETLGESLAVNYNVGREDIDPNLGFDLAGGMRFDLESGPVLGFNAAFEYGSDYQTRLENRRGFTADGNGDLILDSDRDVFRTTRDITASGFLTGGIDFNEQHKISTNFFALRSTQDFLQITEGFTEEVENVRRFTELRWTERQLRGFQLFGDHTYPELGGLTAKWQLSDSTANFDEPDNRIYRYDLVSEGFFVFSTGDTSNSRVWRELEDSSRNVRYDLSLPLSFGKKHDVLINFGQNFLDQGRESEIRRFSFENGGPVADSANRQLELEEILNPEFIDARGYRLIESTRATDNYFATLDIKGAYLGLDYSYNDWLRISAGARQESFEQTVTTFELFNPDNAPDISSLEDDSVFPSFSATFELPKENQIRFNFAETATRPDFKEVSTALFKDPVLDRDVIGNENLITGTIEHFDLRWDKYFSAAEFFSVSLFYKKFTNPIEIVIRPGATSSIISFENAESAENVGIEFEVYKELGFINDRLQNFYVSSNYARIDSEIELGASAGVQTSAVRPLQGQSPYVANLQLGYDNSDRGISASLLYNIFGERISEVGVNNRPDIYEQPFNQLDFVYSQKLFTSWKIGFKAKNLLDDEVEFQQGDELTRTYKKGREFSFSVSYDFF